MSLFDFWQLVLGWVLSHEQEKYIGEVKKEDAKDAAHGCYIAGLFMMVDCFVVRLFYFFLLFVVVECKEVVCSSRKSITLCCDSEGAL